MRPRQLRTGDYPIDAQRRLGKAVETAREVAGHPSRPSFARAAGISVRVLVHLERAERSVGQSSLHSVARALPNWTEDTPRAILEGAEPPPAIPHIKPADPEPVQFDPRVVELWRAYRDWEREYGHDKAYQMVNEQIDLLMLRILREQRLRGDVEHPHDE